jgi:hypothetical protein
VEFLMVAVCKPSAASLLMAEMGDSKAQSGGRVGRVG